MNPLSGSGSTPVFPELPYRLSCVSDLHVYSEATAEGFTYRANTRQVYIKRADGTGEQAYPLTTATQVAFSRNVFQWLLTDEWSMEFFSVTALK